MFEILYSLDGCLFACFSIFGGSISIFLLGDGLSLSVCVVGRWKNMEPFYRMDMHEPKVRLTHNLSFWKMCVARTDISFAFKLDH